MNDFLISHDRLLCVKILSIYQENCACSVQLTQHVLLAYSIVFYANMAGIIILCIQNPPAPCPRRGSITAWLSTAPINLFTRYSARGATVPHVARDQLRMALPLPVLPPPPPAERGDLANTVKNNLVFWGYLEIQMLCSST